MSSSRSNSAARSQQASPAPAPTIATKLLPEDAESPREVDYMQDKVQADADLQIKWRSWTSDDESRGFYRRVFVLLLSWHPDCDDMDVDEEVQRLGATFENTYNFEVESVQIDSRKSVLPQIQANLAVANFVAKNDEEQALFIVYYAGHGSLGKNIGDLNMSGRRRQNKQNVAKEFSHITWNLVESNLKTTRADVFLIFDCCHADDLGRESNLNSRSFEYLAASTSGFTPSPGEKSFTSALIWALEKLAAPEGSPRGTSASLPMIPTSKLAKKIREAPLFPKDQHPSLTMRDPDAYRHIVLAPLPREGCPAAPPPEEDEEEHFRPQFLSLTFHFSNDQEDDELQQLAFHLREFKLRHKDLRGIQLGGLWGGNGATKPPGRHRFREAAGKVIGRIRSHRQSGSLNISPISPHSGGPSPYPAQSAEVATESTPLLSDSSSGTSSSTLQSKANNSFFGRVCTFVRRSSDTKSKGRERCWLARWTRKIRRNLASLFCMSN